MPTERKRINITLPMALLEILKRNAAEHCRSLSREIEYLLVNNSTTIDMPSRQVHVHNDNRDRSSRTIIG